MSPQFRVISVSTGEAIEGFWSKESLIVYWVAHTGIICQRKSGGVWVEMTDIELLED